MLELDQALFLWVNVDLSNSIFDVVLPMLRSKLIWIPVYAFIIAFCAFNFSPKTAFGLVLSMLLTVGLADAVSSKLIKNQVERLRPCNNTELSTKMIKRVPCGAGYSFTSSHAANHFALSFFLIGTIGFLMRRVIVPLLLWAIIICFAQIYVGVHYPSDVFFGALVGLVIGALLAKLFRQVSWFGWNQERP